MRLFVCIFLIFILSQFQFSFAQQRPEIFVKHTTEKITLDGVLDEPIWQQANQADNFWQFFPTDSVKSKNKTEVKMLYNDETLYVGIRAESSKGGRFIVNSLRRDFLGTTNDNVSVMFDTFSDGTNAFMFSANPYGVQREVFVSGGGSDRDGFNTTWDIKWQSEGKIYGNYYILELAIPFSSLKFPEGSQKWRLQTYRWDLQTNEQSVWGRVPQNQLLSSLAFCGEMTFEKPLGKSSPPIYFIPYLNTLAGKTYGTGKIDKKFTVGGDAKIAVGNGMNLDVTVNPDFSNVEVDNVITNLTRFEVSLPEKRQFFIDNNDLFANFGNSFNEARPFFSRRIGIVRDSLGNNVENRILGGLRLSGKLDKNWRLGVLSIQTAEEPENRIASNNNTMFALQRKVFSRSNIGVFMVNRQSFKDYDFVAASNKFNRVVGIDYNLASRNNTWSGKFYVHKSLSPNDSEGNLSAQAVLTYNTRFWLLTSDWVYIDKEFKADLGFVPRTDIFKNGTGLGRTFYHKSGIINKQTPRIVHVMIFSPQLNYKKTDQFVWAMHEIEFRNQAQLVLRYIWNYVYLTRPFDPTRTFQKTPLPANAEYRYGQAVVSFASNNSKMITYTLMVTAGQFYNGKNYSFAGTGNLRIMPKALISLNVNYDKIILPDPHPSANIVLISPKVDLTFSKSVFWSTLIQFSNQRKSLGINSRLQWRFAPLSDLYLVYNDNYYTQDFNPTYRSINLKFTYWLNL